MAVAGMTWHNERRRQRHCARRWHRHSDWRRSGGEGAACEANSLCPSAIMFATSAPPGQQQEEEMQRLQAEHRAAMQAAENLHREKVAAEREGEKEEETADPWPP